MKLFSYNFTINFFHKKKRMAIIVIFVLYELSYELMKICLT